jgi:ribosome-binding factor A
MTHRIKRVNELLKEEIGSLFLKEINLPDCLTTITRVEASPNLQQARIYISVMPEEKKEEVFKVLNNSIYNIQQELNKRLNMRPVPKIMFRKEEKTKQAARVEELLEKIKKD